MLCAMIETARERTLDEAFHHGCAVIVSIIAVTVALVLGLMLACGCELDGGEPWAIVALLLLAGYCEVRAHLARAPR